MIKKILSNKGYVFTYEAVIVAFLFLTIFYIAYTTYSHNMLTAIEEKKDTEKFHKALLLKDLFIKKYEFPGSYYKNDYYENFTSELHLTEKTFDPLNDFSGDTSKFYFIIHSNDYDTMLKDADIQLTNITVNGSNFIIYSNATNIQNITNNIPKYDTTIYFNENLYIPKITGITKNSSELKLYGCNGDHIYFKMDENPIKASARVIVNNKNLFSQYADWKYASPILIINNLNIPLQNYDVKIVFDSQSYINNGEMRHDCGDVRFVDENGNKLNYWIEPNTINTGHTVAWVKVNLAPNEHKLIYMLYGNPSATSEANGDNTFLFFDNFSEENLDKWNTDINNPLFINSTYNNNNLNFTYLSLDYNYYNTHEYILDTQAAYIFTKNSYDTHTAVRFHANFHKRYDEWGGYYPNTGNEFNRIIISNYHWGGELLRFETSIEDENHIEYKILPDYLYNTWNTYEIQRNGVNNANLLINDNLRYSNLNYIYSQNLPVAFYARQYDNSTDYGYIPPENEQNGNISIDWVFVRPYYEPEPTVTMLAENVIFTVNGHVYEKPLTSVLQGIDITPNIKKGINEIRILKSALPVEFDIETENSANFYYLTLSPRNVTIMVKP